MAKSALKEKKSLCRHINSKPQSCDMVPMRNYQIKTNMHKSKHKYLKVHSKSLAPSTKTVGAGMRPSINAVDVG